MKKQLMIVMVVVCIGSFYLQASNPASRSDMQNCARRFVGGVYGKLSKEQSQSRMLDLEELAFINDDAYIAKKEAAFKNSKEVKAALFVVRQDLSREITIPLVERAIAISPTMYATNRFIDEVSRIYHYEIPMVKNLEAHINDGSMKSKDRASYDAQLKKFRTTSSPYSTLTPSSSSSTPLSYYSSSSTPLFFDNCSHEESNIPTFFDSRKN